MNEEETIDYENVQTEVIVSNSIDYTEYFTNIQNGLIFLVLVLIAGILSLSLQIGLKK